MNINLIFDQPADALPTGFTDSVSAVANFFDAQFTDDVTVNLHVGFGEIAGNPIEAGGLGRSVSWGRFYGYEAVKGALLSHATSGDDATSVQSLPDDNPIDGHPALFLPDPQAMALGLLPPEFAHDQFVGFAATAPLQYDRSAGIDPGRYDFLGVVAHEISEVLGRSLGVGEVDVNDAPTWFLADLFHYSDPGVPSFSRGGYASPDGGATDLGDFSARAEGDAGDWDSSLGWNDAFLSFSPTGTLLDVTETDLRWLDVLGYSRASEVSQTVA